MIYTEIKIERGDEAWDTVKEAKFVRRQENERNI